MWVMAIAAVHQPFIHSVMEGLRKGWLDIGMTRVAKLRLRNLEECGFALKGMHTMTTCAAHPCLTMCGALEIRGCRRMAIQAFIIGCLRCGLAKPENLLYVAAPFDMFSTRTMAAFACYSFASMEHCKTRMRIVSELLVYIF